MLDFRLDSDPGVSNTYALPFFDYSGLLQNRYYSRSTVSGIRVEKLFIWFFIYLTDDKWEMNDFILSRIKEKKDKRVIYRFMNEFSYKIIGIIDVVNESIEWLGEICYRCIDNLILMCLLMEYIF